MFNQKTSTEVGIGCYYTGIKRFVDIMGDPIRYQPTHWAYLPEPPTV